jgi:hypothetical protein
VASPALSRRRRLRDPGPARPLAHQPPLRPRPPPRAQLRRVPGRARPRRLHDRLGHPGRRGPLPRLGRHRRWLSRAGDPAGGAPRRTRAPARLLPGRHAGRGPRRRPPGAGRQPHAGRRADRLPPGRAAGAVDHHAQLRPRRPDRRLRQRPLAAYAGQLPHAPAHAQPLEAGLDDRPRLGRPVPRSLRGARALGQRQRLLPGPRLPALRPGAVPRESPGHRRLHDERPAGPARRHPPAGPGGVLRRRSHRSGSQRHRRARSGVVARQVAPPRAGRPRRRHGVAQGARRPVGPALGLVGRARLQ